MVSKKSDQPDRRTVKTQRQLKNSMVKLLQSKPIDKITVAELARSCDIGRGTFYIHYKDVYDLYDAVVADTINQLKRIFEESYPRDGNEDYAPLAAQLINYILEHRPLFDALTQHGKNLQTLGRITNIFAGFVLDIEHVDKSNHQFATTIEFASSGVIGTIAGLLTQPQPPVDSLTAIISQSLTALRKVAKSTLDN